MLACNIFLGTNSKWRPVYKTYHLTKLLYAISKIYLIYLNKLRNIVISLINS